MKTQTPQVVNGTGVKPRIREARTILQAAAAALVDAVSIPHLFRALFTPALYVSVSCDRLP